MKKISILKVVESEYLGNNYQLIKLTSTEKFSNIKAGQFIQIKIDHSASTFLRRPISINFVDDQKNELWILVQIIGDGTKIISQLKKGDKLDVILPLGNGFSTPTHPSRVLLIGGGVGIAPLLLHGYNLNNVGHDVNFLLGFRTKDHIIQESDFKKIGNVFFTTEDGSHDTKGYVTNHSILKENFDFIYTCGPKPMMFEVAKYAWNKGIACEVSLENMMACGFGACLCCVEKTIKGNLCACTEGPVFNIKELTWIS